MNPPVHAAAPLFALLIAACQPTAVAPERTPCPEVPLTGDALWAGPMVCDAQRFAGGDGRGEDWWLANNLFRAVLRHPNAALTLAGLGGGTVVDAAPWGRADSLLEAAPLVDGGWLSIDEAVTEDGAITLSGELRGLPYRPIPGEGERRSVTWRIAPDSPWLRFEGANGLWLHASDDLEQMDGWLVGNPVVYGHDGVVTADLGGALVIEGATGLLISDEQRAWSERGGAMRDVVGAAAGADAVRLYRNAEVVGVLQPAPDGTFEATIPADITSVRAFAAGRQPSPLTPIADTLALEPGPTGSVTVRIGWPDGGARPVRVAWSSADGRSGQGTVAPEGVFIGTGAGVFDVTLSAGPAFNTSDLHIEVAPGADASIDTTLRARIEPGTHVLADLALDGAASRRVRQTPNDRTAEGSGAGLSYFIATAPDDIPDVSAWLNDQPWVQWDRGATLTSPEGWTITAWPWRDNPRESGHGVPRMLGLDPLKALAVAWGGPSTARQVAVDLAWMRAVTASPEALDPRPSAVRLDAPGTPPFTDWAPWFTWLDAQRFVLPIGPLTWLDVRTPERFGPVELHRAVHYGRYSTGTGALVTLDLDGAGPGELVPEPQADTDGTLPPIGLLHLEVQRGQTAMDQLAVLTEGSGVVQTWTIGPGRTVLDAQIAPGRWTLAIGWSTTSADWVVTAPVWSMNPDRPAEDTDL